MTAPDLPSLLDAVAGARVLVVGEAMLDAYLVGRATRLSRVSRTSRSISTARSGSDFWSASRMTGTTSPSSTATATPTLILE